MKGLFLNKLYHIALTTQGANFFRKFSVEQLATYTSRFTVMIPLICFHFKQKSLMFSLRFHTQVRNPVSIGSYVSENPELFLLFFPTYPKFPNEKVLLLFLRFLILADIWSTSNQRTSSMMGKTDIMCLSLS